MIKSILSLLKEENAVVYSMNSLEERFPTHRERETNYLSGQIEELESSVAEITELVNATNVSDYFSELLERKQKQLEHIRIEYESWRDAKSYTDLAEYKELAEKRKILKKAIRKELFD